MPFKDEHDQHALEVFYRHVFHNRREFEYARLPSWSHRYSLETHSIKLLATIDDKIVGSIGLISYLGYINGKKRKIGFFVDNCVVPEHHIHYEGIMEALFEAIEKKAKRDRIDIISGWDYNHHADSHGEMYTKMGFTRINGVNWFGGGTKHVHLFSVGGFKLPLHWRAGLRILSFKHDLKQVMLASLRHERIRKMENTDFPQISKIINAQNEKLELAPRYTPESLKAVVRKYNAKGKVVEINGKIIGAIICFVAPWSGWMYGKPRYDNRHGLFLIKHPIEFAVTPEHAERIGVHLLFDAMNEKNKGKCMFVDVFDRRVDWMRKTFFDMGGEELPYDYGTLFVKNLSGKKLIIKKPVYVPTNLVISPYTAKDY